MYRFEKVKDPILSFLELDKNGVVRYRLSKKVIATTIFSKSKKVVIRILVKNEVLRIYVEDLVADQWLPKTNEILSYKDNDSSNCKLDNLEWVSYEEEFRSITNYKGKIFVIKRGKLKPIIILQDLRVYNLSKSSKGFLKDRLKTFRYKTEKMDTVSVSKKLIKFIFSNTIFNNLTINEYKALQKRS